MSPWAGHSGKVHRPAPQHGAEKLLLFHATLGWMKGSPPLGRLPNEARAPALHSSDLLTRSSLGLQLPAFLRGLKRRKCCVFVFVFFF